MDEKRRMEWVRKKIKFIDVVNRRILAWGEEEEETPAPHTRMLESKKRVAGAFGPSKLDLESDKKRIDLYSRKVGHKDEE